MYYGLEKSEIFQSSLQKIEFLTQNPSTRDFEMGEKSLKKQDLDHEEVLKNCNFSLKNPDPNHLQKGEKSHEKLPFLVEKI